MSRRSSMHRQVDKVMTLADIERQGVRLKLFNGASLFVDRDFAVNERYQKPYSLWEIYDSIRTVYNANSVVIGRRNRANGRLYCTEAMYPAIRHRATKEMAFK